MSVSKRVAKALDAIISDDPEDALFQICAAIEKTARLEGRSKGRKGYKQFISENVPIICGVGLGHALAGLKFRISHPDLPVSEDGTASIADIVYHACRCALYHSAELSDLVEFTTNKVGSTTTGKLLLPKMIVSGLILAVVCSPENRHANSEHKGYVRVRGQTYTIKDCWGQRARVLERLTAAEAV